MKFTPLPSPPTAKVVYLYITPLSLFYLLFSVSIGYFKLWAMLSGAWGSGGSVGGGVREGGRAGRSGRAGQGGRGGRGEGGREVDNQPLIAV